MRKIQSKLTTLIPVALLALLSTVNSQLSTLFAQGTAFTYQGLLTTNGSPANGNYDLTFAVFDHQNGAAQVGATVTKSPTAIDNGLFTVTLDFGPGVFTGPPRWLEIASRPTGSGGAFVTLAARQELTPAPYAIFATTTGQLANNSVTAASIVVPLQLSGNFTQTGILCGTNSNIGGYGVAGVNTGGGIGGGVGVVGQGKIGVSGQGSSTGVSGDSTTGVGVSGSSTAGDGVYGSTHAAGPTVAGVYGENYAPAGTAVVGNALNTNSAGVAGVADTSGSTGVYGRGNSIGVAGTSSAPLGYGVSGTAVLGIGVHGQSTFGQAGSFDGDVGVTGNLGITGNMNISGGATFSGRQFFGNTTRQMLNLWNTSYGIGVQAATEYFRTDGGFAWYYGGSHSDIQNDPGFGGTTLMALAADGTLTCKVLTISGADVAEPFELSTKDLPKGSVVIIDENNPGQLKRSDRAYDHRVAGILSGANGVRAGICLSQQGFNDGGQNVALSGRVYVLADASSGPIRPGDLLTTSDTPGRAMKVTDHGKAQGAIIGKAMGALREGKGMVLVLVTLQ